MYTVAVLGVVENEDVEELPPPQDVVTKIKVARAAKTAKVRRIVCPPKRELFCTVRLNPFW
jgi:hypothetical protein